MTNIPDKVPCKIMMIDSDSKFSKIKFCRQQVPFLLWYFKKRKYNKNSFCIFVLNKRNLSLFICWTKKIENKKVNPQNPKISQDRRNTNLANDIQSSFSI